MLGFSTVDTAFIKPVSTLGFLRAPILALHAGLSVFRKMPVHRLRKRCSPLLPKQIHRGPFYIPAVDDTA